jgi:hypothetical protein
MRLTAVVYHHHKRLMNPMTHKEFSARGGQSGKGESKRRSPEHYAKLARLGVAARRLRAWAKAKGTTVEAMAGR